MGPVEILAALAAVAGVVLTGLRRGALEAGLAALALAFLMLFLHPAMTETPRNRALVIDTAADASVDLQRALRQVPDAGRIAVRGWGLPSAAWAELPYLPIDFTAPAEPAGLWLADPQRRLGPGQALNLDGRVNGASDADWRVQLIGPGEVVVATAPVTGEGFDLRFVPPISGPQVYRLRAVDAEGRTRHEEPLPVDVAEPDRLSVRFDLARPSFEANGLRRWLETTGARLQVHTRLSRGIVRSEGVGLEPGSPADPLEGLEGLDLLVIDGPGFLALEDADATRLLPAIRNGLGVLVLASPELLELPAGRWPGIDLQPWSGDVESSLPDGDLMVHREPLALKVEAPGRLLVSETGTTLVGRIRLGRGALAFSLMNDSHAWRTGPEPGAHARIWSEVLSAVVRPRARTVWLEPASSMPTVGERVAVCAGPLDCESAYPDSPGWYRPDDAASPVYVFAADDWPATRAWQATRDTRRAMQRARAGPLPPLQSPILDDTVRFLLVLLACGALWLIGKLRAGHSG